MWEISKGKNSLICVDERGEPRYFTKAHIKGRDKLE